MKNGQVESRLDKWQENGDGNDGLAGRQAEFWIALQDRPQMLSLLLEQMPCLGWSTDADLRFTISLGGGLAALGGQAGQHEGTLLTDYFPPGHPTPEAHREALAGESVRFEMDLSDRCFQAQVEPLREPDGTIIGCTGVAVDITERRQTEQALRDSEERFRQLAENIPQVFWMMDASLTTRIYVSPAYERIWGRTCQSLYDNPRSWLEAIHPEDRSRVTQTFEQHCQAGNLWEQEYRIIHPDGTVRWIWDRGFPVRNAQGEFYRIAGLAEDITERLQTEVEKERLVNDLHKRVNELTLLHQMARLLQGEPKPIGELLSQAVLLLPPAWQHPEVTAACIEFDGLEAHTPNFTPTPWRQRVEFVTPKGKRGQIEVVYLEPGPHEAEGLFLAEERNLIDSLAEMLRAYFSRSEVEVALRQSEEQFRLLAENIREVFWISNPRQSQVLYVSPAYEELRGRSCRSLYDNPRSFLEDVHEEDRAFVLASEAKLVAGEAISGEYRVVRADGSVRWVRNRAFPVKDERGEVVRTVGLARDITERKAQEDALRLQAQVQESMTEGVCVTDEEGNIVHVNSAMSRMFGYQPGKLVGQHVSLLESGSPEEVARQVSAIINHVRYQGAWSGERPACSKDGTRFAVRLHITPLELSGKRYGVAVIEDITARKKAEDTVARLAAIVQSSGDAILSVTPDGIITTWNPAAERLFGYTADEIVGKCSCVLQPPDRANEMETVWQKLRQGRYTEIYETERLHKDGRRIAVQVSVSSLRDDKGLRGLSAVYRDIAERKRGEALLIGQKRVLEQIVQGAPCSKFWSRSARSYRSRRRRDSLPRSC